MRKKNYKSWIIFLSVFLVVQVIAFVYFVFPLISGFSIFQNFSEAATNQVSDAVLSIGGTLNVKELCFEGGRCIKSAGEMKGEAINPPTPMNIVEKEDCSGNSDLDNDGKLPENDDDCFLKGTTKPACRSEFSIAPWDHYARCWCEPDDMYNLALYTTGGASFQNYDCVPQNVYENPDVCGASSGIYGDSCEKKCWQRDWKCYNKEVKIFDKKVKKILYSGDSQDKIDIVVIGEGFQSDSAKFGRENIKLNCLTPSCENFIKIETEDRVFSSGESAEILVKLTNTANVPQVVNLNFVNIGTKLPIEIIDSKPEKTMCWDDRCNLVKIGISGLPDSVPLSFNPQETKEYYFTIKNYGEFYRYVDAAFGTDGLFWKTEPFKSYKSRFNVWAVNPEALAIFSQRNDVSQWGVHPNEEIFEEFYKTNLKNYNLEFAESVVLISSANVMWSHAHPPYYQEVSIHGRDQEYTALTITHETGHIFGLKDEYSQDKLDTWYIVGGLLAPIGYEPWLYPNCALKQETAESLWKDFVGQGKGNYNDLTFFKKCPEGDNLLTGYYNDGCSHPEGIRPIKNGIMRNQGCVYSLNDWERGFGEYEISLIKQKIEEMLR